MSVRRLCASLVLACLAACTTLGLAAAPAQSVDAARPKLVVLIVVDQLRADLLPRFGPHFGQDGFKRLMRQGAYFPNTYLTYGASATAVGHATIGTGRLPRQHGITNNGWFLDPDVAEAQAVSYDKDARTVGLAENESAPAHSPRNLIGPALGDQLKLADRRSRVFSVALKDRSAILMAGRNPDGVFWWDRTTGKFVTSTWYTQTLPPYVVAYNESRFADRYIGQVWDKALPAEAYAACQAVDPAWIKYDGYVGKTFPHKLTKSDPNDAGRPYDAIFASPFGNEIVLEMAKRILTNEQLGCGSATDMLCVSSSANDMVGHIFGPTSEEVLDMTVRTDRQIAELLAELDRQVGLDRCAIALAGDHGVKDPPPISADADLGGGYLDVKELTQVLNQGLADQFGPLDDDQPYVQGILLPWLWFSPAVRALDADKQVQVLYATVDYLAGVECIAQVFTAADLEGPSPLATDTTWWLAWRSYCPGRSGDIYIHLEAHWDVAHASTTGHGTAHSADRHVPIILAAPGVRPGRYMNAADLVDIAPTLAAIIGIEPPLDTAGRVLYEAFAN